MTLHDKIKENAKSKKDKVHGKAKSIRDRINEKLEAKGLRK